MKARMMVLPVAAMAALGGCAVTGGGPTETREYSLSGFDSIVADSGIDVVLTQGPTFSVKSEAPEGKLDRIKVEQSGSTLKIDIEHEITFGWSGRYQVNVTAPAYASISASGGADVDAENIAGERLVLSVSGGADIDLKDLRIGTLDASASGGGDIEIEGSCTTATLTASGGGNIDGEKFDCDTVTASANGGGDIDVGARMAAKGAASSGGDVRFLGSPPSYTADESSGGDVSVEGR
jgi:hypothetical protein